MFDNWPLSYDLSLAKCVWLCNNWHVHGLMILIAYQLFNIGWKFVVALCQIQGQKYNRFSVKASIGRYSSK